jgi:hypothetical protein
MSITLQNKKFTEELKKTGASVTKKEDQAYKNFLTPKPCKKGEYYRLRLLYFTDDSNKRTVPFIEKYCHTVYNRDPDTNKLSVDFVTCPTSPYLNIKNAWKKCPCCQYADKMYNLAVSTNWSNKTASQGHRKMRRQFVAFVPVYVVSDPNVPENTGRIMILNIRDIKAYEKLCDIIKVKEYEFNVFNGENALDMAVIIENKPQLDYKTKEIRINKKTGEPYTYKDYTFRFSKKPYDLDIPLDQVEALGFDESMYTFDDTDSLRAFLQEHTVSADIPTDDFDLDLSSDEEPAKSTPPKKETTEAVIGKDSDIDIDDIDVDISDDVSEDLNIDLEPTKEDKDDILTDDLDISDIMADVNIEEIGDVDDLF